MNLGQYLNQILAKQRKLSGKVHGLENSSAITLSTSKNFANDAAAATGGIKVGELYHTSGTVKIRLT